MKKLFIKYLLILAFICNSEAYSHYIIVNIQNPLISLSKGELKNIFIGNSINWHNNKKIQIVDYNSESDVREEFSNKYLNLTPSKVSMIWLKVTLSGKVTPPKIFYKEKDVIKYISENIGAIGYINNKSELTSEIKIIEIKP
jgi:ABC-type phosphate transport system substrate-binding protein